MSSILKALRKLEEEKAAMGEGRVDLARDILKRSAPLRDPTAPLVLKVVFFSVLALAVVVGLRLLLLTSEPVEVAAVPPAVTGAGTAAAHVTAAPPRTVDSDGTAVLTVRRPIPAPAAARSVVSIAPEPQPSALETPPAPPEPEVKIVEIDAAVVASAATQSAASAKPAASAGPQPQPVTIEVAVAPVPPEPAAVKAASATETSVSVADGSPVSAKDSAAVSPFPADLPELLISAIAFRPAPGERLAVVNDLPVMEGTRIAGVQIVEILEQGVRFSWQGTEFVLPLTEEPAQH